MKPFLGVLSVICLALLQPQLLKGQGATLFQQDCASCHALPGSGSGPALSSSVGLRRGGWAPLVVVMDQYDGYNLTADIAAIGAYLDSLYPLANPSVLPGGAVGSAYGPATLSGSGGTAPYTFSATGLPNGLNISLSGSLAGTPGSGTQGTYTALFTVTDSTSACVAPFSTCPYSGTFTRTLTIGPALSISSPSVLSVGKIGVAYGPVPFTASGGFGSTYTWSATGLPPGVGIDPTTGVLAGTPTAYGVFNPQFSVHDSTNATFSVNIPLNISSGTGIVSPLSLSAGIAGIAYGPVTFQAAGGTGPYTWSATGLPPGMGIDPSTGALGGIPTLPGSFNPQFTAKDSTNATFVINLPLAITPSAGCNYALSAGGQVFPVAGGSGSFGVTAQAGCGWSVSGAPAWITLTSPMSGTGNGAVSYQVAAGTGTSQTATFTVAGIAFTVEQQGNIAGLNSIGSLAHLLAEENWTTSLTMVNKGAAPAQARTEHFRRPDRRKRKWPAPATAAIPPAAIACGAAAGLFVRPGDCPECIVDCGDSRSAHSAGAGRLDATGGHGSGGWLRHFPPEPDYAGSRGAA